MPDPYTPLPENRGSGGTVVVVCESGALDDLDDLIR
jgi:hypothetical protein